jgi:hypothetical protein
VSIHLKSSNRDINIGIVLGAGMHDNGVWDINPGGTG